MRNIILLIVLLVFIVIGITAYINAKKQKPLVLILMGPPGAGKGTYATELSNALKIPHISTGDLFRENIKNETEIGKKAKELIEKGLLVPDGIVVEMLFDYLSKKGYNETGYILDGFPRTLNQAKILDQRLKKSYNKIVLNLNIDEEKLIERITQRLVCKSCGAVFHKKYFPPKIPNICDKCSGELYQRKDDTEEVLKSRLQIYYKDTKPLLDYYNNQKELFEIDANDPKEIVYNNLLETIKKKTINLKFISLKDLSIMLFKTKNH